jgi:hypothetical protein
LAQAAQLKSRLGKLLVDFFVPGLSRDAAEELYVSLEKRAGDKPKHPNARLRLIRWRRDGKGEPVFVASVGADIDCGPIPMNQVHASAGVTRVIIETETFTHIHTNRVRTWSRLLQIGLFIELTLTTSSRDEREQNDPQYKKIARSAENVSRRYRGSVQRT